MKHRNLVFDDKNNKTPESIIVLYYIQYVKIHSEVSFLQSFIKCHKE